MHTFKRRVNLCARTLSLGALASCSPNPLEPEIPAAVEDETSAREGPGDSIVNEVAGVRVRASVEQWEGERDIFDHVTPVRLEIHNASGVKLRVRYQDFELDAANGETYHALPLYRIGGTVTKPVILSDWDYTPTYPENFYVAPYTAPFYDGDYMIYEGAWDHEPGYYDSYYRYWAEVALPTPTMVAQSLPEGALADGGQLQGWLYFERVPAREELEPVFLTMALVNAETGERLGRIRLPFAID